MRPEGAPRVLRREQRHNWRGIASGRRSSHQVKTAYGRHQKLQERIAEFAAWCAQRRAGAS